MKRTEKKDRKKKSILNSILKDIDYSKKFEKNLTTIKNRIVKSRIMSKKQMLSDLSQIRNNIELIRYVYNALLKYEGLGTVKGSLIVTKGKRVKESKKFR